MVAAADNSKNKSSSTTKEPASKPAAKTSTAKTATKTTETKAKKPAAAPEQSAASAVTSRRKTSGAADSAPLSSTPVNEKDTSVNTENTVVETPKTPKPKAKPKAAAKPLVKPSTILIYGNAPYIEEKGEEYMNIKQRAHFSAILLAWKQELMQEVDRTVHHMQDESANLPDPNDRATQEEEFSLELRTRDRERKLIKKIDETMVRIDRDDYGFCDDCGIEVGIRRLEARPTATLCIDCKHLAEIKEKQLVG
jgi:DnaK suppressor protein